MGTRNLTMVQLNNEIKVAQYGQWDGEPDGQGVTVLEFCSNKANLEKLKERLSHVSFLEDETEIQHLTELLKQDDKETIEWFDTFISRDVCANILMNIINSTGDVKLHNNFNFGYDGLCCEWAYLVNLDTNKLEVYYGGSTFCLKENERFYNKDSNDGYYGIKLIQEYDLNDLPSEEDFIKELEKKQE